jgi:hypothetical protein
LSSDRLSNNHNSSNANDYNGISGNTTEDYKKKLYHIPVFSKKALERFFKYNDEINSKKGSKKIVVVQQQPAVKKKKNSFQIKLKKHLFCFFRDFKNQKQTFLKKNRNLRRSFINALIMIGSYNVLKKNAVYIKK